MGGHGAACKGHERTKSPPAGSEMRNGSLEREAVAAGLGEDRPAENSDMDTGSEHDPGFIIERQQGIERSTPEQEGKQRHTAMTCEADHSALSSQLGSQVNAALHECQTAANAPRGNMTVHSKMIGTSDEQPCEERSLQDRMRQIKQTLGEGLSTSVAEGAGEKLMIQGADSTQPGDAQIGASSDGVAEAQRQTTGRAESQVSQPPGQLSNRRCDLPIGQAVSPQSRSLRLEAGNVGPVNMQNMPASVQRADSN